MLIMPTKFQCNLSKSVELLYSTNFLIQTKLETNQPTYDPYIPDCNCACNYNEPILCDTYGIWNVVFCHKWQHQIEQEGPVDPRTLTWDP